MANMRSLPPCALASVLLGATALMAQGIAPTVRITGPIDASQLVTLKGNVNPHATAKYDRGAVSPSLPMADLTLVLSRSQDRQSAFDAFVASQYDPSSPNYHHWLTPAEIGEQYGPAEADIATISNWLTSQGFAIARISPDRMTIGFSGTAGQAESAFHTQLHNLSVNGVAHIANMTDPQIPAALAPVVLGVKGLHNFLPHPLHTMGSKVQFNQEAGKWQKVLPASTTNSTASSTTSSTGTSSAVGSKPAFTAPNAAAKTAAAAMPHPLFGVNVPAGPNNFAYLEEDVTPSDFATIYNVQPLWNDSITGSGQTIAIVGTSDINLSDVANFRSTFGLPAGLTPEEVKGANGIDPGVCTSTTNACGIGDLEENTLDVEWSGGVATGAQIVLVTSGYNSQTDPTNDPIYQSASYVVEGHHNSLYPMVENASILSLSYGECELGQGTASNVAYYDLWQSAAAEGISVFVASGDAGSPTCDWDGSSYYGNPYSAQYGLTVNGTASSPYDTAVGGTDFSWCKPTYNANGTAINGCPSSSTSQGSPAYWNTGNNGTTGESALGYVPETPWNDTCMNPIWAGFIESLAPLAVEYTGASTPANPEAACNYIQNNWISIYENYGIMLAPFVDTVGGSGGASNCVVNNGSDTSSCSSSTTSTGSDYGSIPLYRDGWEKPAWQTGVEGIPSDGVRDLPDVSFFAGDGALQSAYLVCVSALGSCVTPSQLASPTTEPVAQEVGGTSVATQAMAGVMALIDQKEGAAQGLANPELYTLASEQTYSECSAEGPPSANCNFHSIDHGTNAMPCDLGAYIGGTEFNSFYEEWEPTTEYEGIDSPNCTALNAGDQVGTQTSGGVAAYNATAGYNLATGLGSLNVDNVAANWTSDAGTASTTLTVNVVTSLPITINQALELTITVSGGDGTPTGSVVVSGAGYDTTQALVSGAATVTIPANSLTEGSNEPLVITYSGDSTYASNSKTVDITVDAMTPTVTVTAPSSQNIANAVDVTVTVSGPGGSIAVPTGNVSLSNGVAYNSAGVTLSSSGTASFTIPANTLPPGSNTLTATYSGDSNYTGKTGTAPVDIVTTALATPTITVTPSPGSIDSSQSLGVTVTVGGSPTPTGWVTLTAGSYTSPSPGVELNGSGVANFTVPSNSFTTAGSATLTAHYSGDSNYESGSNTGSVTVTQSVYALSATSPSVAAGSTTTSTVTVTSTTDYTGDVALNCTVTNGPTDGTYLPGCTVTSGSPIVVTNGTPTGTATLSIFTTSNTAMLERPGVGGKGWMGAGGGAVLAFLVFLGIPRRRRNWRSMLGLVVLMAMLGGLSACGGGGGTVSGGPTYSGTAPGTYTFQVTGQGSDPAHTAESATFTVTVN